MDVRPKIAGDHRIKFKAEALPLKDEIGGVRTLYSHNALPAEPHPRRRSEAMATLVRLLPPLRGTQEAEDEKVELVNHTAVEEVLLDIGMLDFGKGVEAKANVAVWRTRGEKAAGGRVRLPVQVRARGRAARGGEEAGRAVLRPAAGVGERLVSLGTTKTGTVYRLKGNAPQSHE